MGKPISSKSTTSNATTNHSVSMRELYHRAYLHFRDSFQGDIPLAATGMFQSYVLGTESKQTYRYLRKVLRERTGNEALVGYQDLEPEFSTDAVARRVAGMPLDKAGSVFQLWGNAARELKQAYAEFEREMTDGRQHTSGSTDGGAVEGTANSEAGGSESQTTAKASESEGLSGGAGPVSSDDKGADKAGGTHRKTARSGQGTVRSRGRRGVAQGSAGGQ